MSAPDETPAIVVRRGAGDGSVAGTAIALALALTAFGLLVGPRVSRAFDRRRVNSAMEVLGNIRRAVVAPDGFVAAIGTSPGSLSELARPVWNAHNGAPPFPKTGCGHVFSSAQVSRWDKAGPFLPFFIDERGLETPIGVVTDTLRRISRGALAGELAVVVDGVSRSDAAMLDEAVDGGDGRGAGTVRWNDGAGAAVYYTLPITNVC